MDEQRGRPAPDATVEEEERALYEDRVLFRKGDLDRPAGGAHDRIAAEARDFAAIWQAADKVVYSSALAEVSTRKTRIERRFDADDLRSLKAVAGSDLAVGGAELAGHALAAGLVDECHAFLAPAVVGDGNRALPDHVELTDERRFESA